VAARGLRGRRLRGAEALGRSARIAEDTGKASLLEKLVEQADSEMSKMGPEAAVEWSNAYLKAYHEKN